MERQSIIMKINYHYHFCRLEQSSSKSPCHNCQLRLQLLEKRNTQTYHIRSFRQIVDYWAIVRIALFGVIWTRWRQGQLEVLPDRSSKNRLAMRQTFYHHLSRVSRCWHADWMATFLRLSHIQSIWDCRCVAMNNSVSMRTCRKPTDCDYTRGARWWSFDSRFQFDPLSRRSRIFSVEPPIRLCVAVSSWKAIIDKFDLYGWKNGEQH